MLHIKQMKRNDLLDAREDRVSLQQMLIRTYKKPLLVTRVNMPGSDKDTQLAHKIFRNVEAELRKRLKDQIRIERMLLSPEGPVMVRVIDMPAEELKSVAITVENETRLGRLTDLDVYDSTGESISRIALGHQARRCYICDASAHECVRSKKHHSEELLTFMENEVLKVNRPLSK